MYYICHKINYKRGGSHIESPESIKNKEATIIPKKKYKFFQCVVMVTLQYKWKKSNKLSKIVDSTRIQLESVQLNQLGL